MKQGYNHHGDHPPLPPRWTHLSSLKGSALTCGVSTDLAKTAPSAPEITADDVRLQPQTPPLRSTGATSETPPSPRASDIGEPTRTERRASGAPDRGTKAPTQTHPSALSPERRRRISIQMLDLAVLTGLEVKRASCGSRKPR